MLFNFEDIVTILSDYRRGLDWRFDLLTTYTLTTRDYSLQLTVTHRLVSSVYYGLHYPLPGNGFQRRTFPLLWVRELSPCLSYQLLSATAH
jgi:hypothetical protein